DFTGPKVQVFEIAIQVRALLAIFWQYRGRMISVSTGFIRRPRDRRFALNVVLRSVPAPLSGLLFGRPSQGHLFVAVSVALGFIAGALVILWVEKRYKARPDLVRIHSLDELRPMDAFKVGCAQAVALIPGTSRSGASIIGGLYFGMSRT